MNGVSTSSFQCILFSLFHYFSQACLLHSPPPFLLFFPSLLTNLSNARTELVLTKKIRGKQPVLLHIPPSLFLETQRSCTDSDNYEVKQGLK